jgi:hypothetical protein
VPAGGSCGFRALCRGDASLVRALARSRYGRRNG